ncbi:hypothetical protein [Rhizobium herbae]|uniref:Uncharacterized protein n=1 Tax=Rhizobium herbae TaxID=508661 RepID=A0ABS4EW63_9HYPH|nr:hypothetical protein [Rhizobium herbae]MBP1862167.1 hypothetical protein [Rhizobium herbae]
MLSDALHTMRERFSSGDIGADLHGVTLALRAFEIEARNMETRIEIFTGRPHVPLDGNLITAPVIDLHGGADAL